MAHYDSYVICTSPRSGSTLLCDLLTQTDVAGRPNSHFHRPSIDAWLDTYKLERDADKSERVVLGEIFQHAIERGTGGTGLFGLRLQRHSFDFFSEKLAVLHPGHPSDVDRFQAAFGRTLFIHLKRDDKVEQAISHVKAEQTGLWHVAPDGTEIERNAAPKEPVYDSEAIRARFDEASALDRQWEDWFSTEGIEPLRVSYHDLASDPPATLRRILEKLGLNGEAATGVEPGVAKLADKTSNDWARRFRSELSAA
ncbi:MAG: Stf0 family sulfotransferase [Pseudomonadota bacterium]